MPEAGHPKICCNARTRKAPDDAPKQDVGEWAGEGYCRRVAGEGTDHLGEGRCRYHGGAHNGRPVEQGLYSKRREDLREDLTARIEEAEGIDVPGSMWAEVAVLRALLSEFLDRMDEVDTDAIEGATKLQREIRMTVDTLHQMQHRDAASEEEIDRLVTGFASVLETYVPESQRSDALDELESIVGSDRPAALKDGPEET